MFLVGCASVKLPPQYFPLGQIVETPLGRGGGVLTTIYGTSYTGSIAAVDSWFPPGSAERDALLRHEQQHSIDEFMDPTLLPRYVLSLDARYAEEQRGYAAEIRALKAHGAPVPIYWMAGTLSSEEYGGMVTYDEALKWVRSQVDLKSP